MNPLWAWVAAANDMLDAGHEINFQPKTMYHETTKERLFGAGVAFGEKLKWALSRTFIIFHDVVFIDRGWTWENNRLCVFATSMTNLNSNFDFYHQRSNSN